MTRQQHSSHALLLLSCLLFLLVWTAPLSAEWKEKVLYSFQGGADGAAPVGGVVVGPDGTLYGATQFGGADNCSPMAACGTVYQLTPQKDGSWAETVLYVFKGKAFNDGEYPEGGLIADSSGNLYGTTAYGRIWQLRVGGKCGRLRHRVRVVSTERPSVDRDDSLQLSNRQARLRPCRRFGF